MFRPTRPLFRFDPGWLFIVAGLTVCAAGILLPAQAGLHRLREQLRQLGQEEDLAYARLKGHLDFIDGFDRADARLVRRMAATHLNLIPAGDEPLLLAPAGSQTVTDWIDATVSPQPRDAESWHDSILSRWATGQERLWLFAAGALCVFVGLLLDPAVSRALPTGRGVEPEAIRRVAESAGYSGAGIVESETRWQVAAELAADRNDDDSPRWQAKGSVRRADATSHAPEIDPPQSGRGAVGDDAPEAMAAAAGGTEWYRTTQPISGCNRRTMVMMRRMRRGTLIRAARQPRRPGRTTVPRCGTSGANARRRLRQGFRREPRTARTAHRPTRPIPTTRRGPERVRSGRRGPVGLRAERTGGPCPANPTPYPTQRSACSWHPGSGPCSTAG
jgi:hypothetical protein